MPRTLKTKTLKKLTTSPSFVPFYCGVVHLVNDNDQVSYTSSLYQHGMFTRLTSPLESRLKLPLTSGYHLRPPDKIIGSQIPYLKITEIQKQHAHMYASSHL